jgi:ribonuclease HII
MPSNFVFQIRNDNEYIKFKEEIENNFLVNKVEFKESFIKDRFQADTPEGKITFIRYANEKLMIQSSPDSKSLKFVLEKANQYFKQISKQEAVEENVDLTKIDKDYFIGLDESGAGETFGSLFLGIAIITRENLVKAQEEIKPKDVKTISINGVLGLNIKSRNFFARKLKRIKAFEIDSSNKIELLDSGYIELMRDVEREHEGVLANSCIILDNYGIGPKLTNFFEELKKQGSMVILSHKADSTYLPPMAASIIARKARNTEIEKIAIDNSLIDSETKEIVSFTAGSPSNPLTDKWLITYRKIHPFSEFPNFVRLKWKNVKEINEKFPKKQLSHAFSCEKCNEKFEKLFIKFNRIKFATELICPKCGEIVSKKHFEECFKTTSLVMDTSSLISRTVSKDLKTTKYLEGMKILLPSCLYEEIDSKEPDKKKGAENEIQFLIDAQAQDLIDFEQINVDDLTDITNDKKIIHVAKKHSASIITKDRTQNIWSQIGCFVFEILEN